MSCAVAAGELIGCGIRRTCVRLCGYQFGCSLDEAEYVLIIEIDETNREATFTIGGNVNRQNVSISHLHTH